MPETEEKRILLLKGRDESLKRRHPWIFSGAVKKTDALIDNGDTVEVYSIDGHWLGRGAWSSHSQISIRIWTFDKEEKVDEAFFRNRLMKAIELRDQIFKSEQVTACRLVNAESDGLPGVTVDRYGQFLVCQFLSAGAERWKHVITGLLMEKLHVTGIYERSDTDAREKEGLQLVSVLISGEMPPGFIEVQEGPLKFSIDVVKGHKTGFYLDQRENRLKLIPHAAKKEVLNCFSYTGGFGVAAGYGMAAGITNIDTSAEALELAMKNFEMNGIKHDIVEFIEGDVFQVLRKFRDGGRSFDIIILDPPKFVASASQLAGGARGYKDINLLAMKLLRKEGILFTFSCSGYIKPDLFQKIVADAANDAGRQVQILEYLTQGPDHPVALYFPEGLYLKGMVCRVI